MRSLLLLVLFTPLLGAAEPEFTPLFDGKSLNGWTFIVKPDKDGKKADPKETESFQPSYERLQAALPKIQIATDRLTKNPQDYEALVARAYFSVAALA